MHHDDRLGEGLQHSTEVGALRLSVLAGQRVCHRIEHTNILARLSGRTPGYSYRHLHPVLAQAHHTFLAGPLTLRQLARVSFAVLQYGRQRLALQLAALRVPEGLERSSIDPGDDLVPHEDDRVQRLGECPQLVVSLELAQARVALRLGHRRPLIAGKRGEHDDNLIRFPMRGVRCKQAARAVELEKVDDLRRVDHLLDR
mmetsp:Transcript_19349/g.58394  ORF Transcript_19349/g.58394 Transcript_19349/m.58394 type:complete len:200 (-) Transcript_19349:299-898(-)